MAPEKLVKMAREIAANVVVSDDPNVIGERLADHLQRFWDPRMRRAFVAYAQGGAAMSEPLAIAARKLAADSGG